MNPTSTHANATSGADYFLTTRWTLVRTAGRDDSPQAAEALEKLCQAYWYPIYVFVRRRGREHADAQDLTQAFFTQFLQLNPLSRLSQEQGRFRSYLRASVKNFLANEFKHAARQKRGGGATHLSIDWQVAAEQYETELVDSLSPDRHFDRAWVTTLLERVLHRLGEECARKDKSPEFEQLKPYLSDGTGEASYAVIAQALGISNGSARVKVCRLRQRYQQLLLEEVAQTCDPEACRDEIEALMRAFED